MKILVVEDNAVNRMVINGYLKRLKQAPDSAENGKKALEIMLKTSYDLVFMDCEMPVMSGFEATRSYRKQRPDAQTPIIALTAHALEEKKKQCLEAGMDDFLTKPLTLKRLKEMIQRWG